MKTLLVAQIRLVCLAAVAALALWSNAHSQGGWVMRSTEASVTALADAGHCIWVGTPDTVLCVDKYTGRVTGHSLRACGLRCSLVRTIAIDSSDVVWVGTDSGGLASFDGTRWTAHDSVNFDLVGGTDWLTERDIGENHVSCIVVDSRNHLWIGTARALVKYDRATWSQVCLGEFRAAVGCIAFDSDGTRCGLGPGPAWGGCGVMS